METKATCSTNTDQQNTKEGDSTATLFGAVVQRHPKQRVNPTLKKDFVHGRITLELKHSLLAHIELPRRLKVILINGKMYLKVDQLER